MGTHVKASRWKKQTKCSVCVSWTWPRCFHVLCQKNDDHERKKNLSWSVVYLQMLSYTQLFWTEKTSYLMQYLVSNTNMESVSSSKKKRKKYQLSCIYLLDKCKGFLPFHVWILWKQNPFFFFFYLQSTYCSVLVVWMDAWLNRVTFPVYVKKESVPVCVQWVCRLVSLKQYEW